MCGRFSLIATPSEVAKFFGLDVIEDFPPRYNIAPTQPVLMTAIDATGRKNATLVRWGLVPSWVKDPGDFALLLNARSETAVEKPSFRNAMRHRRTLIPASGFYEWHRPQNDDDTDKKSGGGNKQAYWIKPKAGGLVAFGGLMETWIGANGSEIDSGCILTTAANEAIAPIHHRMPVVIKPEDFDEWLDCKTREPRDVAHLMKPVEPDFFTAIPVSDRVNKVTNTDPAIQEAVNMADANAAKHSATQPRDKKDQLDLF